MYQSNVVYLSILYSESGGRLKEYMLNEIIALFSLSVMLGAIFDPPLCQEGGIQSICATRIFSGLCHDEELLINVVDSFANHF